MTHTVCKHVKATHTYMYRRFEHVLSKLGRVDKGTYKVRNEIETKRNQRKRNETKRNQQKRNETKRNQRNENETNEIKTK